MLTNSAGIPVGNRLASLTAGPKGPILLQDSVLVDELADTVRDPRGFAVKFYTEDGIWDLVGNNTPIFFIRDPILVNHLNEYLNNV